MRRMFGIFLLLLIYIGAMACAIECPQFKSSVSTTGITVNFDTLYQKADQLNMIHDIKDHDGKHIIWAYKDTGNWAIVKDDGALVIATPSVFSLDVKGALNSDLYRAKNLIKSIGGRISEEPSVYYVDDPYLYRFITYDFGNNFYLRLSIPNCTLQKAMLSISGSDYTEIATSDNELKVPGQHYLIDGIEVSGCDGTYCSLEWTGGIKPKGISCVPQSCEDNSATFLQHTRVSVKPVEITNEIAPGIHTIEATGIGNQHTMTIEAVTSPSEDEMLLFPDDYSWGINETRSKPMAELYALIMPSPISNSSTYGITSLENSTGFS